VLDLAVMDLASMLGETRTDVIRILGDVFASSLDITATGALAGACGIRLLVVSG
jgi:hypothetical protein